jgi:hypothetical protein
MNNFHVKKYIINDCWWIASRLYRYRLCSRIFKGNISGGNQPLRANYGNFNLNHKMLNQGKTYGRWEG